MKIASIQESGSNDLLRWAIQNGADVFTDRSLQSLIDDELGYLVTLQNVTTLELYRLASIYRNNLAIVVTNPATIPSAEELAAQFPGKASLPGHEESQVDIAELVQTSIGLYFDLIAQMQADSDLIPISVTGLYPPMLTKTWDVQIPVSFITILGYIMDANERADWLSPDYPAQMSTYLERYPMGGLMQNLLCAFIQATELPHYFPDYRKYLDAIKFASLKTAPQTEPEKLYKFVLNGFHCRNRGTKGEYRCGTFHPDPEQMKKTMKCMGSHGDGLYVDFVVQLPVMAMCTLLNSFSEEELPVRYLGQIQDIIQAGMPHFNLTVNEETASDDQSSPTLVRLDHYEDRIKECEQISLNVIQAIRKTDTDISNTTVFGLLPGIYETRAQITLDKNRLPVYLDRLRYDTLLQNLFLELAPIVNGIARNIMES